MAKSKEKKLENPSVLAFEAKLILSDGVMKSGKWENREDDALWKPIRVETIRARGTISNRMDKNTLEDASKLEQKIEEESKKPNPLIYDKASLPFEDDTLRVNFTLRILGNIQKPTACNIAQYEEKLSSVVSKYIEVYGFKELAKRYAHNIANGRFLWRNRVSADSVEVRVKLNGEELIFDAYKIGLKEFNSSNKSLEKLSKAIEEGLCDTTEEKFVFMEITAFAKMGNGQQVYPSQKMNMESKKGEKSKFLFKIDEGKESETAGMHSQKIGNALRTIDDWHTQAKSVGAISVEPYGSVTSRGVAYRTGSDNFYKLLDDWILKDKEPKEEAQHFVMATLIRGGVFSESKEKKS